MTSVFSATAQPVIRRDPLPGINRGGKGRVSSLADDINAIISDRSFADASWGISVVSCDKQETLYGHNDLRNRQVASNIKLLTTGAAIWRLGSDYTHMTEVYISGEAGNNAGIYGDLVIRTMGDPTLSPSFGMNPRQVFRSWAATLDSLGIHSLRNVVVDASYFDELPYAPGWAWDDEPFGYNAQISAASVYDNSIEVRVTPGKMPGDPVSIDISPSTAYVTLRVTAGTSRVDSTSTLDIRRERGSDIIVISGNIATGSETYVEHISIEQPPLFYATIVSEELARAGIEIRGSAYDAADFPQPLLYQSLRKVVERRSPPLREIVAAINKQSLNLAAEMTLKSLGREFGGGGTTVAGIEVVKRFLADVGIDIEHLRLYDGSGLSRQNMLSPADMTKLLQWLHRSSISADFLASLSIAGVDGTLASRLVGTRAEKNMVGKTGYLSGIRALSGYVRTRDGELLAFSIVSNNYSVPTGVVNTAQDLIIMRLASFSRRS